MSRGWRPLAQTIAAAAVLVASLGWPLHLALVPHEVCEAHGELVDARSSAPPLHDGPGDAEPESHDDCPLLLNHRHALPTQGAAPGSSPLFAVFEVPGQVLPCSGLPSLAILDVAPKTSPPG